MIVLHIGTDKTGSTAVQELSSQNRDYLKSRGWLYPKKIIAHGNNHGALTVCLRKNEFDIL